MRGVLVGAVGVIRRRYVSGRSESQCPSKGLASFCGTLVVHREIRAPPLPIPASHFPVQCVGCHMHCMVWDK